MALEFSHGAAGMRAFLVRCLAGNAVTSVTVQRLGSPAFWLSSQEITVDGSGQLASKIVSKLA